jgi:hypothetical protein
MTDENWLAKTIVPKSDQLNADDLIAGPITVTIEEVIQRESAEQPVEIRVAGYRPYKPCKSMRRLLIAVWGTRAADWVGRKLTLVCDPSVTWGGVAVGGIRVHAMSHIDAPFTMALTATRGKRKPITVQPIVIQEPSFLDKWRAEFGGAASDVMEIAKAIAGAYTAKDLAALDVAYAMVLTLPVEQTDEDHLKALQNFANATRAEIVKE